VDIGNCSKCGKMIIVTPVNDLCVDCLKEEEEAFEKVSKFLKKKENRRASMEEVVEATGVEEELIYKFIRKGRIQLVHFPNLGYPCEICGKIIRTGKLCDDCSKNLQSELRDLKVKEALENKNKVTTYYAISEEYRKIKD